MFFVNTLFCDQGDTQDEGIISDDDEEDYDALNDETFGGDGVLG